MASDTRQAATSSRPTTRVQPEAIPRVNAAATSRPKQAYTNRHLTSLAKTAMPNP